MKFVILLVAVLVLAWLVSGSWRRYKQGAAPRARSAAPQVEGMVACAHCGVHLPASLAVAGEPPRKERYCSVPHRDAGPRAP